MKRVGVREIERKSMWSENEETDRKSRKRELRERKGVKWRLGEL